SRALYELLPLDSWPVDKPTKGTDGSPDVAHVPVGRPLEALPGEPPGIAALNCFIYSGNELEVEQEAAILAMINELDRQRVGTSDNTDFKAMLPSYPTWSDAVVAYGFQRILGKILKTYDGTVDVQWCFNGPIYHALVTHQRARTQGVAAQSDVADKFWCEDLMESQLKETGLDIMPGNEDEAKKDETEELEQEDLPWLPIDDHKQEILDNISQNRVTIIHGETGCGKSSKVPLFLLGQSGSKTKMFVSQPRRIAARALADRVRQAKGAR
ncbi:unnamed protein product, partial [Chrysoparadoxa australica]